MKLERQVGLQKTSEARGAMATARSPQQIAKRALILGAVAFRASLEVTNHPRVAEISRQLLPWLDAVDSADELDPIERDLLAAPPGQLSDGQRVDANWGGEAAALFCWMLNLRPPLPETSRASQSELASVLRVLKPEAVEIVRSAALRDRTEIEDMCQQVVLVRSALQELRVAPPASEIIRRSNIQRLIDVGLVVTDDAVRRASEAVSRMTAEERSDVAGIYFVRSHAAVWLLSDRGSYFA